VTVSLHGVPLAEVHAELVRNIVSLRVSRDLFDDLSTDPAESALAQRVEAQVRPPAYTSAQPVIDRPFEEAAWFDAIAWPFEHWRASRYSDGSFGVWYGATSAQTTVWETAYHWVHGLLADAGFQHGPVTIERKLYAVACDAALPDLRRATPRELLRSSDYTTPQALGRRLHHEGHPGLLVPSVRHAGGEVAMVLRQAVLSRPRFQAALSYRLEGGTIRVERTPGRAWMKIDIANL
jgi:RES domain